MVPTKINPGVPQAQVAGRPSSNGHSIFKPSVKTLGTYRFGEYTPHFFMELLPNDKNVTVRCSHILRTLPMKSPIFNRVKLHKSYFDVPMQAIIPLNYEKWKVNPVQGDDCPADAGTTIADFMSVLDTANGLRKPTSFSDSSADYLAFFRYLAFCSWFGSEGSLLSSAEIQISNYWSYSSDTTKSVDDIIDLIFIKMVAHYESLNDTDPIFTWSIGSESYDVFPSVQVNEYTNKVISLRDFFYRFMLQPIGSFSQIRTTPIKLSDFLSYTGDGTNAISTAFFSIIAVAPVPVDLRRVLAYQIACAHFFSNDHIDYIFSAQLYRQNMWALATVNPNITSTFLMNGVTYNYDALSAHIIHQMISNASATYADQEWSFLANVFNFNRSLRFVDYFTGSRSNPLAVGITDVQVVGSKVSVIDMTKGLQRQKFLNAVNRAGAKFESYVKGVLGVKPAYDYHNPAYLGTIEDDISMQEVENTAAAQGNNEEYIRTNMRSNSSRFALNFDADRDSVVVGVTYFDIPRFHPFGIPRICQHLDRFDEFIPQAQYIGDQDINRAELGNIYGPAFPFSYTDRYQEYKLRKNFCFGGIRQYLRTWSYMIGNTFQQNNITPDFIRSRQEEFDKFYTLLTNYSPAGYFHFIIYQDCEVSASRPMVKHPQIL